jgi:oligosaccharide repeat unit polymerase
VNSDLLIASSLIFISLVLWLVWVSFLVKKTVSPMMFLAIITLNIFIIRPIILLAGLDVPNPNYLFASIYEDVARAQLYVVLWVFFLLVFGLHARTQHVSILDPIFPRFPGEPDYRKLAIVLAFFLTLTIAIAISKFRLYGSYETILYMAKIEKAFAGSSFIRQVPGIAMVVSSICLISSIQNKARFYSALSAISLMISLLVYYMWGAREAIAIVLLGVVLLLSRNLDGTLNRKKIAFGFFVMVLLSTISYVTRLKSIGASEAAMEEKSIYSTISISLHMVRYDAFMLLVRDWDFSSNLRWGEDLLMGNLAVIPRIFWEDKPLQIVIGAWFRQLYEPYTINGWPISVIGQWVISFHWLGIVLGAYITTSIFAAMERRYMGNVSLLGFFCMLFLSISVFQNGSILQVLPEYTLWLVPLIAIGLFVRRGSSKKGGVCK